MNSIKDATAYTETKREVLSGSGTTRPLILLFLLPPVENQTASVKKRMPRTRKRKTRIYVCSFFVA
jgi:hypothetical protein